MRSRSKRIVRYKKPLNINIGVIIFALIFLYLGISCILYLSKEKISIYEVVNGESEIIPGITTTGIALRSEQVTNAPVTGYINYYVKEGSKIAVGSTLYTIDENGDFSEMLQNAAENDATLTNKDLAHIRSDISSFVSSYDKMNFEKVYEFRYNLNASLIENVNLNALDAINQSLTENGSRTLNINTSDKSGIIELYTDGLEGITPETVTDELFNTSSYKKQTAAADKPVEQGTPIFKTVVDEAWKIMIQLTEEQAKNYEEVSVVDIYFPSENIKTSAYFSIMNNGTSHYGVIDLKRYMVMFADKRYIDIQIIGDSKTGLKIPKSAVAKKSFFTIPEEYMTSGGDSKDEGFLLETINENGETSAVFTAVDIVKRKDGICYIDDSVLKKDSIIIQPNSTNRYKIESTSELFGVYNVNTGYTTFRQIEILSEKNGYYIVESGTKYGLQVYDQIVLNASLVGENQVIFK